MTKVRLNKKGEITIPKQIRTKLGLTVGAIFEVKEQDGMLVMNLLPLLEQGNPPNIIEVPANLLRFENGDWQKRAYVYALDSTTIGITGSQIPEWKEFACFTDTTPIKLQGELIVLQIPEKFSNFYKIERKHKATSVGSNRILITISGNLIEEKKYPA
jgi:AbrB family looped-hinge helix DNA binding protein